MPTRVIDLEEALADQPAIIEVHLDPLTEALNLMNVEWYLTSGGGTKYREWKHKKHKLVSYWKSRARCVNTVKTIGGVLYAHAHLYKRVKIPVEEADDW